MAGTYCTLLLHIVFSTKRREPWLRPEIEERLYPYIGGIIRAEKGILYEIGGAEDHIHIYIRWRPDKTISDLMRTVKARSSRWIHDLYPNHTLCGWQDGYSVFSVSRSQENAVKKYIAGQKEHHKKESFKTELLRFFQVHGVEFDEQHVFE